MPIRNRAEPPTGTPSPSWEARAQNWSNTTGYITVPKRNLPINNYLDTKKKYEQSYFSGVKNTSKTGVVSVTTQPTAAPLTFSTLDSFNYGMISSAKFGDPTGRLSNAATISALGKVADMKFNLAVATAEVGKTCDLILSSASRLLNAYRALRRRDFAGVARYLNINPKRVHKTWLEYKYGWMPVLMDVKGAAEFLAQHNFGRPPEFSATGYAEESFDFKRVREFAGEGGGPTMKTTDTLTGTCKCKVKIFARIDNPNISTAAQLGLTNPMLIAWEVTPFSFVFDWFISVGDYLTALTALHGVEVLKVMKSYESDLCTISDFPGRNYVDGFGTTWFHGPEHYVMHLREYQRQPHTISIAQIYPPRKQSPLSIQKMITSLALMRAQSARL